mmetsp:Transcript_8562/g.30700  ORF Transcript_8562/g.30700 Transcript_8562/m.30700 type:complete len:474 (-) Transcript_8562:1337-2758(-)
MWFQSEPPMFDGKVDGIANVYIVRKRGTRERSMSLISESTCAANCSESVGLGDSVDPSVMNGTSVRGRSLQGVKHHAPTLAHGEPRAARRRLAGVVAPRAGRRGPRLQDLLGNGLGRAKAPRGLPGMLRPARGLRSLEARWSILPRSTQPILLPIAAREGEGTAMPRVLTDGAGPEERGHVVGAGPGVVRPVSEQRGAKNLLGDLHGRLHNPHVDISDQVWEVPAVQEEHLLVLQSGLPIAVEALEEHGGVALEAVLAHGDAELLQGQVVRAVRVDGLEGRTHRSKFFHRPALEPHERTERVRINLFKSYAAAHILVERQPGPSDVAHEFDLLAGGHELVPIAAVGTVLVHRMAPTFQVVTVLREEHPLELLGGLLVRLRHQPRRGLPSVEEEDVLLHDVAALLPVEPPRKSFHLPLEAHCHELGGKLLIRQFHLVPPIYGSPERGGRLRSKHVHGQLAKLCQQLGGGRFQLL